MYMRRKIGKIQIAVYKYVLLQSILDDLIRHGYPGNYWKMVDDIKNSDLTDKWLLSHSITIYADSPCETQGHSFTSSTIEQSHNRRKRTCWLIPNP
jgi:hypothetical protein